MIRAQVIVRPRASIFDPQGDAVRRAIHQLGLQEVTQVHVGKAIELELNSSSIGVVRAQLETICRDLLSNPVIEDYELNFLETNPKTPTKTKKPVIKKKAPVQALKKLVVKKKAKLLVKKTALKKAKKKK